VSEAVISAAKVAIHHKAEGLTRQSQLLRENSIPSSTTEL